MSTPTILCVDDEHNVLLTLRTQLSRHFPDYAIEIAASGDEALALVDELLSEGGEVPLVIADQIMPGMKGDELLIKIHARYPAILKVMLTGQARVEDLGHVVNHGNLYRFIAKPWNETDLSLTVAEALRCYQREQTLEQQQAALEQSNQQLVALNADLEQRVQERTQALEQEISDRKQAELALQQLNEELEDRVQQRTQEFQQQTHLLQRILVKRKQVEDQLRETNERLMHVTRLKDEFLATMSHELRTPLHAILGLSECLRDGILGELTERQRHAICTMERSGSHLLALITDILDLSKIEAGKLELNIIPVSIQQLCENSLTFVRQMALKKKIHLSAHIPENIGITQVDELRFCQVLSNLLSNAIKFTPEGGSVNLAVHRQSVARDDPAEPEIQTPESLLLFSVTDTGIGIASDDLHKLFQPFVQIDSSLNRQYGGSGLGLALVRRIVELHGGEVFVSSEVGQGSCFTVQIPGRVPPVIEVTRQPEEIVSFPETLPTLPIATQSPLILLAEDNEANVEPISSYLENCSYRLIFAGNGAEAIELTKTHHPDLILMDIHMPGVDGLSAIRSIREDLGLTDIPIIALTALAMEGDLERCLEVGATQYLMKPISLRQLVAQIQKLVAWDQPLVERKP